MDIGRLTATLAVQNRGFVEANRAMQNLQKTTLQAVNIINNRLDALEGQVGALTGKLTAMGQASASANRMIGDSTAAGVGKATASFDTLSSKMHQAAMGLRSFGWLATTVFTLPIAAAGKTVLKSYSEFEYSMMKIVGLVGIARSEIEQWSVSVKEMSKSIGRSPLELADALYYVTSSGYKTAAALGVVEQSAKAAAAGLGETQDIADLVTSVMNAYGQGNISVAKTLDVLTAAVREGKGEASQYAKVLGSVVPFAAQLGVTFDEVSGAVASMTLSGASAANAATYLRNIFMKLLKPAKQSEDALRAMGSSTAELRNMLGEQGLMPTLIKIRELTNTYGEDMLGKVIPNIRAMLAELMLTGKNLEYNQQVMESVTNSNMDLAKAYQAVYDVTKNRLNRANAELKSSLIDLGESLKETIIPILENLAKTLANIVEWFIALDDSTKRTVLGFTAFLALIGPASLIASTFGLAIHQVAVWVNGLARAMGVLRVATIGASGPIGAAITLLGVGVVALARYQKRLTDAARDNNVFEKTLVDVNGEIKKLKELTAVDYSILGPEAIGKMNVQARNEVLKLTEGIQEAFMRGFEDNNSLKNMEVTIGGVTDKLKNFSQETQEAFKSKLAKKYTDEVVQGWETIGKTRQKFLMKEAGPQDDYLSKILIPNLLLAKKQYDETSVAAENFYKTWQEQLENSRKTGTQTEDTFNATAALALMNEQLRQIGVLEKAYAELGVEGYDANKERLELYNDALREFIENGHGSDAAAKAMAEAIKNLSFIVETSKNKLYQFGEAWSFIEAKEKALGDGFDATAGKLSMYNEMLDTFIETTTEAAKTGADLNKVTEAFVKHNGADIFEGNVPTTYEETLSRIVELIQKYIDVGASEELQKSIDLLEKQAKAFGDLDIYLELLKKRMQVTRSEMVKLANASKEGINSQAFKDAAKAFLDLKDAYIDLEASLDAEVVLGVAKAFGSYASAMDMVQVATNITEAKIRSLYEVIESNRGEAWTAEMEEQMGNLKDLREEVLKTQLAMESLGWIANLWDKLTDSIGEADEKWAKWVGNILRAIPQVLAFMQKYGELFGITFGNSKAQAILEKSVQNRNLEAASIEKVALAKQNENIAIAASLPLRAQANLLSEAMVMSKNKELEAISKLVPVTTTETAAKVADAGASAQAAVANSVNAATAIVAANAKAAEALASAVAEAAKMPFPYSLVAIALNSAAVTTALSVPIPMVTKMATGGVVPEGYPNDTFPALLSSGETVIPKGKAGEYAEKLIKEKQQKKRLVEFSPETEISSILIPKLQHGGEIPPGYPNDTYPAFLSSGETVLPKKLDFIGFAFSSNEASAKEYEKAKEKYPEVFKVIDQRTTDTITGKPVSDYSKLHGSFDATFVEEVVKKALARGIDPYTALAIPHVETGGTPSGSANPFAVNYENPQQLEKLIADPIGASLDILRQKLKLADKLGYDTYAKMVQMYNGMGTLTQGAVGGKKAYGIEIPDEGIKMRENPLYGKRVEDVRNNILMQNEELVSFVESLMKDYPQPTFPSTLYKPEPPPPIEYETSLPVTEPAVAAVYKFIEALQLLESQVVNTAASTQQLTAATQAAETTAEATQAVEGAGDASKASTVAASAAGAASNIVSTAIQGGNVGKAMVAGVGTTMTTAVTDWLTPMLSAIPIIGPFLAPLLGGLFGGLFSGMASKMAKGGIIPPGYPNDSFPALLSSGETVLPKEYKDMPQMQDVLSKLTKQGSIPSGTISDELQLLLSTYEINFPEEKFKSLFAPLMKQPRVTAEKALDTRKKVTSRIYNYNNYSKNLTQISKAQANKTNAMLKLRKESTIGVTNSLAKLSKGILGNDKTLNQLTRSNKAARDMRVKDASFNSIDRLTRVMKENKVKARVSGGTNNEVGNIQLFEKISKMKRTNDKSLAYLTRISRGTEMTEKMLAGADYYPNVARMAGGGAVPPGYPNDSFPAFLSSGEYVLPSNVRTDVRNIEQKPQKISIVVDGKVSGKDLMLVLRRANVMS